MNTELLKEVRDKISTTPAAYDQSTYGRTSKTAPCGTAGCIAGWVCVLSGKITPEDLRTVENGEIDLDLFEVAVEALGITGTEAMTLFTGEPDCDWPEPFSSQWMDASHQKELSQIAVAYLDQILTTGEVK